MDRPAEQGACPKHGCSSDAVRMQILREGSWMFWEWGMGTREGWRCLVKSAKGLGCESPLIETEIQLVWLGEQLYLNIFRADSHMLGHKGHCHLSAHSCPAWLSGSSKCQRPNQGAHGLCLTGAGNSSRPAQVRTMLLLLALLDTSRGCCQLRGPTHSSSPVTSAPLQLDGESQLLRPS